MTPIVYLREEQVVELVRDAGSGRVSLGVGFEWPGEDVFHVFSRYPLVAPAGRPIPVYFRIHDSISSAAKYKTSPGDATDSAPPRFLDIELWFENDCVQKRVSIHEKSASVECDLRYVPQHSELYSRSKGLLEIDVLSKKRAVIVGMGSFGSTIAVELAKSGLGAFSLYDFDRLELANVSRHAAGISDLGRFKTHAIRDAIWNRNPFAKVESYEVNINDDIAAFERDCARSDLVICVTDENRSRCNVNEVALRNRKPAIFGRAITRAAGGDVFRLRPGCGPCLACIQGLGLYLANEEVSNIRQARRDVSAYISQERADATVQVGLASDIAPITNMVVKLSLLELSRGQASGIATLESDLTSDFYIWANRRDVIYGSWPPMEHYFNRNSVLRWYGVRAKHRDDCIVCNTQAALNHGEEI